MGTLYIRCGGETGRRVDVAGIARCFAEQSCADEEAPPVPASVPAPRARRPRIVAAIVLLLLGDLVLLARPDVPPPAAVTLG